MRSSRIRTVMAVAAALAAGLSGFNALATRRRPELVPPLDAPPQWLSTPHGAIRFYEAGAGPTVLMLHSFNAAGTAYELRPLFERLAGDFRVVAFDWLGFGLSQRPPLRYTASVYQAVLASVLDGLTAPPVRLVALSLPCQYAAVAAAADAGRFHRLVLISPTEFASRGRAAGMVGGAVAGALRTPLLGEGVYNALTTRPVIRKYLSDIFANPALLPDGYARYAWATSRRPNARYAPAAFIAGLLDAAGAPAAYRDLTVPSLLLFGDRPRFADLTGARRTAEANPHLRVEVLPDSGDLPHMEQPEPTARLVREFLR